jgi:hypothetical protein
MTGPRPVVIGAPSNPSDSPTRIHSSHSATERNSAIVPMSFAPIQFTHEQLQVTPMAPTFLPFE